MVAATLAPTCHRQTNYANIYDNINEIVSSINDSSSIINYFKLHAAMLRD